MRDDEGEADVYLNLTLIEHTVGAEAARTTVAPTSPLAARAARRSPSRKEKGKGRAPRQLPGRRSQEEQEAANESVSPRYWVYCLR